jgi:hypothetical protein
MRGGVWGGWVGEGEGVGGGEGERLGEGGGGWVGVEGGSGRVGEGGRGWEVWLSHNIESGHDCVVIVELMLN